MIEDIESLGSDKVSVFGGKFNGGIFLQQVPLEITECLQTLLKGDHEIKNYLEVGVAGGGTTFLFNRYFDLENIVLLDDNRHGKARFRHRVLRNVKTAICIGNSRSPKAINFVKRFGKIFDVAFIDGDHRYIGVSTDVKNYSEFIVKGGYLILHDTVACKGVERMFEEMKLSEEFELIGEFVAREHNYPCGIGVFKKL